MMISQQFQKESTFVLLYLSYVFFYFDRKNYSFWLNEFILNQGMRKDDVSIFGSIMESSYGAGKLIAGPLVDTSPPLIVLSLTLFIASLCNLCMFQTGVVYIDYLLWSTNGIVQSAAWPALAAIFLNWYKHSPNRGTMYSILSTSQNVGSALCPVVLTFAVQKMGWQSSVIVPGVLGVVMSFILYLFVVEHPDDGDQNDNEKKSASSSSTTTVGQPSLSERMRSMVTNRKLLALGLGYAFLSVVRVSIADWSLVMLQEVRGLDLEGARNCMVSLEMGGFIGGISAGIISDRMYAGRRGPPLFWLTLFGAPVIGGILWLPMPDMTASMILPVLYLMFGFLSFGPHMFVGLTAREVFPEAASSAGAFTKSLAQVGGTLAGFPLSRVVEQYSWYEVGIVWVLCLILGAFAFGALYQVPAYDQASSMGQDSKKRQ